MTSKGFLPLRQSRLPEADALLPYLREIDRNKWYSNFGALHCRLEERLAKHFRVEPSQLVCLANGTTGLTLSLRALNASPGVFCLMPSFTFAAVPAAAVAAGMIPFFMDVNPLTWALDPTAISAGLANVPGRVGAVIVVSPFGAPIDPDPWDRWREETGMAVVVDAAWGFDSAGIGQAPVVVSLHATKVLGIGEGGLAASRDAKLIGEIRSRANFGFGASRLANHLGGNGKLSEYGAAVGLAALDRFPMSRNQARDLAAEYLDAFAGMPGVRVLPGFNGDWASAAFAVGFDAPVATHVSERLASLNIESRNWWGAPCHLHPAFQGFPHGDLKHTEALSRRVLNLPFFPAMKRGDVVRVRDALAEAYDQITATVP